MELIIIAATAGAYRALLHWCNCGQPGSVREKIATILGGGPRPKL